MSNFGTFKTPYGQTKLAQYMAVPKNEFNKPFFDKLARLHIKLCMDMLDPNFDIETYGISDDQDYTADQLLELFNKHIGLVELHIIRTVEDYFDAQNTDPDEFFSAYKNGDKSAKLAFVYARIHPMNVTNVWAEMRFKDHMILSAQTGKYLGDVVLQIIGDGENQAIGLGITDRIVSQLGSNDDVTEQLIRYGWKKAEHTIRNLDEEPDFEIPAGTRFN